MQNAIKERVLYNNGCTLVSVGVGLIIDGSNLRMGLIYTLIGCILIALEKVETTAKVKDS